VDRRRRADLRQQRLLSASARSGGGGEERSYLLSGSRLAQFEDWATATRVALTPDERRHLEASLNEHQRQRRGAARRGLFSLSRLASRSS